MLIQIGTDHRLLEVLEDNKIIKFLNIFNKIRPKKFERFGKYGPSLNFRKANVHSMGKCDSGESHRLLLLNNEQGSDNLANVKLFSSMSDVDLDKGNKRHTIKL